jgi:hypothetical protein
MSDVTVSDTRVKRPRYPKPRDWRPRVIRGRCGAWSRSKHAACTAWPIRGQKRCRVHGGIKGELSDAGRKVISEASQREWREWRAERGLPETWRYSDSRRRGGRQTAAQWLAEHGQEGEQS